MEPHRGAGMEDGVFGGVTADRTLGVELTS